MEEQQSKKFKYGIIYMNHVPDGLTVKAIREIMSQFGEVGRIYLVPDEAHKHYIEGWIEFKKKRVAKLVADMLNNTPLKYGKWSGQVWNLKYLHRFKWSNLIEQLAHDRAMMDQKRRFELDQAKRKIDFHQRMLEKSKRKRETNITKTTFVQKEARNRGNEMLVQTDENLLATIFKKQS